MWISRKWINISVQGAGTFVCATHEKAMDQFILKFMPAKDRREKVQDGACTPTLHKRKHQIWIKYKQTKSYAERVVSYDFVCLYIG